MKKGIIYAVLAAMLLAIGGISYYYWYENANYVSTDDANVTGDIISVSPQIAGKLVELNFSEGDRVQAGQIMGRVDDAALPPGANPDLVYLKAPINGTVLQKEAHVGEVVAPGSPVALMVNLQDLHIVANIEETKLNRIHLGQRVDITIDSFPGVHFSGHVYDIEQATQATFSLLPPTNASGNFTKITQRVPVKVSIDDYHGLKLYPGMSAEVKVHIR